MPHTNPLEQPVVSSATIEEEAVLRPACPEPGRTAQPEQEGAPDCSPTHAAGRGWTPLSRDLGIPSDHGIDDPVARLGGGQVFTRERRVRFLDHLAFKGNARAAAALVNVSHETAYRARRQDAAFAALWDAAMVHARCYGEQVLATRALDGVEVPIVQRGEITGYVTRQDTRLLLAHLARLDRRVDEDAAAQARAGRFDELLGEYAGHEAPEPFAAAVREVRARQERGDPLDVPPTREEYVIYFRDLAMDVAEDLEETDEGSRATDELALEEEFMEEAGEEWDAWHQGALARVGSIVEPDPEGEGEEAKTSFVIPANAGTQRETESGGHLGPRVRGDDEKRVRGDDEKGEELHSPLPLAGGVGGGPVAPPSDTPTPDPSREREGDDRDTVPTDLPYEIKSACGALANPRNSAAQNRVTSVNPRPEPSAAVLLIRHPELGSGPICPLAQGSRSESGIPDQVRDDGEGKNRVTGVNPSAARAGQGGVFSRTPATPRRFPGNPRAAARSPACKAASATSPPPNPPSMTGAASSSSRRVP